MSKLEAKNIETLRQGFQSLPAGAGSTKDCPNAETIWDAAAGDLPVDERRQVVSHLSTCGECNHAWRLAWAMQTEMRRDEEGTVVNGPWSWTRYTSQIAAAALLVVTLGVGVLLTGPELETHPPVTRGLAPAAEVEIRSLIPEGEALPRDNFVLRWTGPQDASYSIRVLDMDMDELTRADHLEEPIFRVPADSLAGVSSQEDVYWSVALAATQSNGQSNPSTFITRLE